LDSSDGQRENNLKDIGIDSCRAGRRLDVEVGRYGCLPHWCLTRWVESLGRLSAGIGWDTMTDTAAEQATDLIERLFEDLLGAMTTFSVYLGDTLGLYRALAADGPATPAELASRAGIHERYAREWLEHQAVDGILEVAEQNEDPSKRRYALPEGHAAVLTDPNNPASFAPFARVVAASGIQLSALAEAYRTGGGVPWEAFGEHMRTGQGDANRPMFLHQLSQEFLPQIPDVYERLTSQAGARVADIGCGHGWSAIALAKQFPNVTVDGYDLDGPSIEEARVHAKEWGVDDRVHFYHQDAANAEGTYDLVVAFECMHDMPRPVEVLSTMRRLAGDSGAVIVMDERAAEEFAAPADAVERLLYGYSILICLPDSMSSQPSVATGTVMRPSTLRSYALDAGFSDVEVLPIETDFFRFYRLVG
jgi:2-polyprenyl-3-methyl-5-hydroxy-6-metoxy-1,4-benzoquinol methylase